MRVHVLAANNTHASVPRNFLFGRTPQFRVQVLHDAAVAQHINDAANKGAEGEEEIAKDEERVALHVVCDHHHEVRIPQQLEAIVNQF